MFRSLTVFIFVSYFFRFFKFSNTTPKKFFSKVIPSLATRRRAAQNLYVAQLL